MSVSYLFVFAESSCLRSLIKKNLADKQRSKAMEPLFGFAKTSKSYPIAVHGLELGSYCQIHKTLSTKPKAHLIILIVGVGVILYQWGPAFLSPNLGFTLRFGPGSNVFSSPELLQLGCIRGDNIIINNLTY